MGEMIEGSLCMGKGGEVLKCIHPLLAMKRKGQTKEYLLFYLFMPVLFLRVLLPCNAVTSVLQKE